MVAKIQAVIGQSNFELIRDQIGAVLALEIANQKVLSPALIAPDKIWIERFVPFDASEYPAIKILYQHGSIDEGSREILQAHYTHTYFIDVMFSAKSTADAQGDQLSSVQMQKMLGIIRAILSSPAYSTIGFSRPFNKRAWVNSIEVFEPMEMQDETNQINGRVEYCIEVPEYGVVTDTGVPLNEITTTVRLNESDKGYFWDYIL
jgi:hypothetical protein